MVNLSNFSNATTAANALAGLVLVSPQATIGYQPQNPTGPNGEPLQLQQPKTFLFDYEGEQKATFESDITDHFSEANLSLEDQIALKPERFTTRGYIGELTDVVPALLKPLKIAADKLLVIGAYTPELTVTALEAYQTAKLAYDTAANVINAGVEAWSSVSNLISGDDGQNVINSEGITPSDSPQNKQQVAFQALYGYWRSRTLFTIQTPWAVFQDMAIERLVPTQTDETNVITEFEIQFKMIRRATVTLIGGFTGADASNSSNSFQNYSAAQAAGLTDLGISSPVDSIGVGDGLSAMGVA